MLVSGDYDQSSKPNCTDFILEVVVRLMLDVIKYSSLVDGLNVILMCRAVLSIVALLFTLLNAYISIMVYLHGLLAWFTCTQVNS